MGNSYLLKCNKCYNAQQILYEIDNYEVAEAIHAEYSLDFPDVIEVPKLIDWLQTHSKHSKIEFLISC